MKLSKSIKSGHGRVSKGTYFVKLTLSPLANQPSTKNNSLSIYRLSTIYDYHTRGNSMHHHCLWETGKTALQIRINALLNPEMTTIGHLWTMCRRCAGWGFHKQYLLSNSTFRSTTRSRRPRPKSYQDTTRQRRLLLHFDGEWFHHATSRSRTRTPASVSWQWRLLQWVPPRRSREDFSRVLIWAEDFAGGVEAGRQGGAATGGPNPWR